MDLLCQDAPVCADAQRIVQGPSIQHAQDILSKMHRKASYEVLMLGHARVCLGGGRYHETRGIKKTETGIGQAFVSTIVVDDIFIGVQGFVAEWVLCDATVVGAGGGKELQIQALIAAELDTIHHLGISILCIPGCEENIEMKMQKNMDRFQLK